MVQNFYDSLDTRDNMVDIRQTEPERRAALEELTALRRELKTETAAGAKAAKSDPRFIAAQQRLDAAKSAAGMRTSAQDLAALNRIATQNVSTADMTPAQRKKERQALNQPSRQYFKQVTQEKQAALNNPTQVPFWKPSILDSITGKPINKVSQATIDDGKRYGMDYSKARLDWVLVEPEPGQQKWAVGIIGGLKIKPNVPITNATIARDYWMSDTGTLGEISSQIGDSPTRNAWSTSVSGINLSELSQAIPEIMYSEFQEIMYRLSLEKDTDITIEDILDKYDELYGEG